MGLFQGEFLSMILLVHGIKDRNDRTMWKDWARLGRTTPGSRENETERIPLLSWTFHKPLVK
jgi:hypothetical protein